jgi:autotransporter-associated beta strand protein
MNFSAIKVCGAVLSLLFSAALALAQTTPTTLPIYTDSLQGTWVNVPAGATVSYDNTNPVKVGTRSISVKSAAAGTLISSMFSVSRASLDTTPYRALKFWIHGGTAGGQKLKLALMVSTNELGRFELLPAPQANTWTQVAIALTDLGISATQKSITGLRIIEETPSGITYYLDDIHFTSEAVASVAGTIYDDLLRQNWTDNPYGVVANYSNTSPVYSGSNSIAVTTTAGGTRITRGLRFNIPLIRFNTTPYKSLSFQVHGGATGGQNLSVKATIFVDGGGTLAVPTIPVPIPKANEWTRFTVPLTDLGIDNRPDLTMLEIREEDGTATTFYIDDVRFETEPAASVPLPVFDDFVRGVWESTPYGITENITNTTPVKAGNRSIACTITGVGAMQFTTSGFDASPFASVSFWIHGGTTAAANRTRDIFVSLIRPGVDNPQRWVIPKPAANTWTQHTVPLSALGADGATQVSGLRIASDFAQPIFYLDDIQFERPSAYTLTYSGNGHTGGTVPVAVGSPYVPGSTATIVGNTGNLTRGANYNFLGWNTAANGTGTNYAAGDTVVLNRNLVLYAQWNYTGITYPLAYDGNGHSTGSVPVDASSPYIPAATVTVANAPTLSRTGHTFGGWNTAANGTGTNYAVGATFAITQATTLYAKWIRSTERYSVTYLGNGQTEGDVPVNHASPLEINDLVIIADKASLVKTNEPFLGWNTAADGSGTRYFPGDRIRITTNLNLYAQYGAFRYPYEPYNQKKMDPQLTGWPISQAAIDYVVNTSEVARRPGRELAEPQQKMDFFSITPVAGHWGWTKVGDNVAWYNTHKDLVAKIRDLRNPKPEIFLVGDSITSQWGGGQTEIIQPAWTAHFGTTPFANFGIGGDKTYNVLWRLDRAELVGTINPKVVVLQIGHNNMFFATLGNVQYAGNYGIKDAVDGIVWCVRNLRSKFPTTPIILVNVFPTRKIPTIPDETPAKFYDELKATRAELNARNLAATDPLVFELDLWNQLSDPITGVGHTSYFIDFDKGGNADGVHLTEAGYQVWAAALKPLITAINAPTVRYDANGASSGTVPSDTTTYANRETVTVRANSGTLSKSGHTFKGWNTRPDGSGTLYEANATFTITAPTTLYATWVPSSTVRFTRNVVDAVVKASATATFSVAVSGATAPTFQWERAPAGSDTFAQVVGQTTALIEVNQAPLADHGVRYRVKVTSGATTVYSQAGALQVLPVVPATATDYKYNLPDSFTSETHTSADGRTLGYRLFSPSGTPPAGGYPLVVVLPGKDAAGKPMMALAAQRFIAEQAVRPCYIAVPICPLGREWSTFVTNADSPFQTFENTEMRLLREAINELQASPLPIDNNRLYLVGFNQGGYAVWDLLQRDGARWAAAVPVLGGGDPTRIASVADTLPPIWAGHSWSNNNLVPVERTRVMVSAVQKVRPSILYSEYNGVRTDSGYEFFCGYKSPNPPMPPAQPHLTAWLFAQARNTAEVSFATVAGNKALPPWNQCAGAEFAGPVTSYDHFFWSWEDKRNKWATEATNNQDKVVFIGDSITDGWSSLSTDFPKFNGKVLNMGISGDMSRGVLTRIQDVIDVNPKAVSLLIGTNDITHFGPNSDEIATIIVNNIDAIIKALHARLPNLPIIVSTIMPTGNTRQDVVNALLKTTLANRPFVSICDVNSRFKSHPGGYSGLYSDGLHPNPAGYSVWAEELDRVFASAGLYATEPVTNARAWDGGGTNTHWSTRFNWNTVRNGTGGEPESSPSTGNIAVFNTTGRNSPTTATLSGNVEVDGIEVINTDATQLFTDNLGDRNLNVGAAGIDLKAGSGGLKIAESNEPSKKIRLFLNANQTWTNNGTGVFRLTSDSAPNINLYAFNLTLGGSGNFDLTGRIAGTGSIVKTGNGKVTLHNSASSFTGPLSLLGGVWEAKTFANVNTDSDLGKGSATSNPADLILGGGTLRHSFANVASTDRRFTLGSASARSGTLDSSAIDPAHTLSFTSTGALAYGGTGVRPLTLTGTNTGDNRFSPGIANGTGGATSLVKSGSGRWVLAGTSTYTGTTSVNAGTLAITGTLGTTAVTVASGATLTGNGQIGGSVTVASGGRLLLDVATTPAGQQALRFSGNLVLTAGNVVELKVPPLVTPGSYTLVTTAGITGSLGSVQISGSAGKLRVVGNSIVFTFSQFARWCAQNAITGAAADVTTVEGRTNFFNYAFVLNPTGAGDGRGLHIDTAELPTLGQFSYNRRIPASSGISYVHEYSTDLNTWQTFTPVSLMTVMYVSIGGEHPYESATVILPVAQRSLNRIFIRVRASAP